MKASRTVRRALAVVAAAVLALTAAHASVRRVPLDDDMVRSFIGSFQHVKKKSEDLSANYGDEYATNDPVPTPSGWFGAEEVTEALDRAAQAHGFTNFSAWVEVLSSIAAAYVAASGGGAAEDTLLAATAEIESNSDLPAEQKALVLEEIRGVVDLLEAIRPSEADVEAIRPYLEDLASVFEHGTPAFA